MIEVRRSPEIAMTQTAKNPADSPPADPYPPYRPVYAWVFQAWLLMFLAVICIALVFYLLPHLRGGWNRLTSLF
jgi:hypothetical protein